MLLPSNSISLLQLGECQPCLANLNTQIQYLHKHHAFPGNGLSEVGD